MTNAYVIRIIKIGGGRMKRRELIKRLEDKGWYLKRHGAEHDIYTNGKQSEPIPRHPDINAVSYTHLTLPTT